MERGRGGEKAKRAQGEGGSMIGTTIKWVGREVSKKEARGGLGATRVRKRRGAKQVLAFGVGARGVHTKKGEYLDEEDSEAHHGRAAVDRLSGAAAEDRQQTGFVSEQALSARMIR
eukprot:4941421-Pleurochrysis_carterae.AAC.1